MRIAPPTSPRLQPRPLVDVPLPSPTDELVDPRAPGAPAPDETLGEALHDVASAGQDLLVDRLELFRLEVTESVKERVTQAKVQAEDKLAQVRVQARGKLAQVKVQAQDQLEKVKAQAQLKAHEVAEAARDGAYVLGLSAAAGVLLAIAWGLLCAAAVVALAPKVGAAGALAIVAAPHLVAGVALLLTAKRGRNHGHP